MKHTSIPNATLQFRLKNATVLCLLAFVLAGCAAGSRYTAKRLRDEAVIFHEDQIMDNLIRACNKQLILHVKVVDLNSQIEATESLQTSAGETVTHAVTNSVVRPIAGVLNPFQRKDTVQFQTSPITDDMDAYAPYILFLKLPEGARHMSVSYQNPSKAGLEFLTIPDQPFTLVHSPEKPPEDTYVPGTLKKKGKEYYYVPKKYNQAYFELCLALTNYGAFKGETEGPASKSGGVPPRSKGQPKKSAELKALEETMNKLNRLMIQ